MPDSNTSLAASPVSQHDDGSDVSLVGNDKKARPEYQTLATANGTQELSGHFEQDALAQYADAA